MRGVIGDKLERVGVKSASYEVTDPTIDSQIVSLQSAGVDTFILVAIPKFAAQAIRKVYDIGWKPLFLMSNVATSVGAVIKPAGPGEAGSVVAAQFVNDPN